MIDRQTTVKIPQRPTACIPVTARERLVLKAYAGIDEAASREIDRLGREEGVTPSCRPGCFECCGQHVLMNPAEAHALAQFIRRNFSAEETDRLRWRVRLWHAQDEIRLDRPPGPGSPASSELDRCGLFCPLLVEGRCSVYPVRPVICRTHFVSSHPSLCRASFDSRPAAEPAVSLTSVLEATRAFSRLLRTELEGAARDASGSIMLLPHWLAIEMGWDFAIEP